MDERYVLVQLGAGAINEVTNLYELVYELCPAEFSVVVTRNPLRNSAPDGNVKFIEVFPVAKYYAAFDFSIQAAGYNSVQETISLGLPSIYVPNASTKTDDQTKRARGVADAGLGLIAQNKEELEQAIDKMTSDSFLAGLKSRLQSIPEAKGADEVASLVTNSLSR